MASQRHLSDQASPPVSEPVTPPVDEHGVLLTTEETPAPHEPPLDVMALPPAPTPTLHEAFRVTRDALAAHFQDEDVPSYLTAMEAQSIYDNAGGALKHPNTAAAWRQLVMLLEQALGANLRMS